MFPGYVTLNPRYPRYKCAYVKIDGMKGKVIVFNTGKMIRVGTGNVEDAENDLVIAYSFIINFLRPNESR